MTAFVQISGALNFRELIADIANTTEAETTFLGFDEEFGTILTEAQLSDDRVALIEETFFLPIEFIPILPENEEFSLEFEPLPVLIPEIEIPPLNNIEVLDGETEETVANLAFPAFDSPFAIQDFFKSGPDAVYVSSNIDAEIAGFGGDEIFFGVGTFKGHRGEDEFLLSDSGELGFFGGLPLPSEILLGTPEPTEAQLGVTAAYGGADSDFFLVDTAKAKVFGGAGDDDFVFLSGDVFANGGTGADSFTFASDENSGMFEVRTLTRERTLEEGQELNATLGKFNTDEDTLVFDFSSSVPSFPEFEITQEGGLFPGSELSPQTTDLASMLRNDGTLADVERGFVNIDGVELSFFENRLGHTVFEREGTGFDGQVYDERIVVRNTSLEDILLEDVMILNDNFQLA